MRSIQVERLRGLPVRRGGEVWEVASAAMPAMFPLEPGGKPEQMVACVCVSTEGGMMMGSPQTARSFADAAGIDAVASFALDPHVPDARPLNYLPARILIGDMPERARTRLLEAMVDLGVMVETKAPTPTAEEALEFLANSLREGSNRRVEGPIAAPGLARVKGMSVERIAAFADAAAAFWRAAPWRLSRQEILWRISPAPKTKGLSHVTVMGAIGEEFGLGFLAGEHEVAVTAMSDDPLGYFRTARRTLWSVSFEPGDVIPEADALLWEEHSLAAADSAGDRVYPIAMGVGPSGKVVRPTPADLTFMEGVLRALAGLRRKHLRHGDLEADVETFEGVKRVVLAAVMGM